MNMIASYQKTKQTQVAANLIQCMAFPIKSKAQPRPVVKVPPRGFGPIQEPNHNDVLCGRGGKICSHEGNIQFRDIVNQTKIKYLSKTTKKMEKAHIAANIVARIRSMDPPGRFLQQDDSKDESSPWYDVGDEKAIKKVSQALREDAPDIKKGIKSLPVSTQAAPAEQHRQQQQHQHQQHQQQLQNPNFNNGNMLQPSMQYPYMQPPMQRPMQTPFNNNPAAMNLPWQHMGPVAFPPNCPPLQMPLDLMPQPNHFQGLPPLARSNDDSKLSNSAKRILKEQVVDDDRNVDRNFVPIPDAAPTATKDAKGGGAAAEDTTNIENNNKEAVCPYFHTVPDGILDYAMSDISGLSSVRGESLISAVSAVSSLTAGTSAGILRQQQQQQEYRLRLQQDQLQKQQQWERRLQTHQETQRQVEGNNSDDDDDGHSFDIDSKIMESCVTVFSQMSVTSEANEGARENSSSVINTFDNEESKFLSPEPNQRQQQRQGRSGAPHEGDNHSVFTSGTDMWLSGMSQLSKDLGAASIATSAIL